MTDQIKAIDDLEPGETGTIIAARHCPECVGQMVIGTSHYILAAERNYPQSELLAVGLKDGSIFYNELGDSEDLPILVRTHSWQEQNSDTNSQLTIRVRRIRSC